MVAEHLYRTRMPEFSIFESRSLDRDADVMIAVESASEDKGESDGCAGKRVQCKLGRT